MIFLKWKIVLEIHLGKAFVWILGICYSEKGE